MGAHTAKEEVYHRAFLTAWRNLISKYSSARPSSWNALPQFCGKSPGRTVQGRYHMTDGANDRSVSGQMQATVRCLVQCSNIMHLLMSRYIKPICLL